MGLMKMKNWQAAEDKDDSEISVFAYIQCFFMSIATILGTGILGLPLMLSHCGFYPFLVTFILSYLMQIVAVYFVTQLLQVCQAALADTLYEAVQVDMGSKETLLLRHQMSSIAADEDTLFPIGTSNTSQTITSDHEEVEEVIPSKNSTKDSKVQPNLYVMGKLFLNKWIAHAFYFLLFMHFNSVLISYVLAGSEAYGQLLHIDYVTIIPIFMWTLTAAIILLFRYLQPIIALITLAKGTILVVTIFVTCYVGVSVHAPITNNWYKTSEPFLMEAVALGGLPMVMPMLYGKFSRKKSHIKGFRTSLYAGLTVCMLLNVAWCWAVLNVVPQTDPTCQGSVVTLISSVTNGTHSVDITPHTLAAKTQDNLLTLGGTIAPASSSACDPRNSLEGAKDSGLISTVPLTQFIIANRPEFRWIALLLQIFIMVSITVSYLTLGSAMQHTVIGVVDYIVRRRRNRCTATVLPKACVSDFVWHAVAGTGSFLLVFLVAELDPKGFVNILDKLVSLTINFICGPVIFLMLGRARSRTFRHLSIPLPGHPRLQHARYLLLFFFSGALIYELLAGILGLIYGTGEM